MRGMLGAASASPQKQQLQPAQEPGCFENLTPGMVEKRLPDV